MPKRKDLLIFTFKFLFSFIIIIYLLTRVTPIKEIGNSLKEVNLFWLFLSFSLHSLGLLISAYRWQILIHAQGDRVPLGFLAKSYLVGNFFNLFLPTRFGGDVVRIRDGSRYSQSLLKSSAIVLVERLTGIIVLLLFALFVSLYRLDMAQQLTIIWIALPVGIIGLLVIFSFFTPLAGKIFAKLPEGRFMQKIKERIFEFRDVVLVYKDKKSALLQAIFWAFLLQVNVILHYFFAAKAFHVPIPFLDYFIFIPIVLIILTIPVTISGLGLREVLFINIFQSYSIPDPIAVSFSLIADFAFTLIIGIAGGIIYVFRK